MSTETVINRTIAFRREHPMVPIQEHLDYLADEGEGSEGRLTYQPLAWKQHLSPIGGDPGGAILVERTFTSPITAPDATIFGGIGRVDWVVWTWRIQTNGEALFIEGLYTENADEAVRHFNSRHR